MLIGGGGGVVSMVSQFPDVRDSKPSAGYMDSFFKWYQCHEECRGRAESLNEAVLQGTDDNRKFI